ncbi:hypothetical protein Rhe02_47080 [Rhizocola hellebori]|uniref:Replication-relaxation n=1 Tax=Rhizocola hellebori TaxID=1392758 RepID=A0A8J3VI44_9ACTN|nr:replication-relaxation family protein [Rhizocola hellebori]GIH06641.1 hypothetical protein Rhe02_47080 [Rhizocola hellebori]
MSRTYVTARKLIELERSLSPRETNVLSTLARVRLATSTQLERLHFTDITPRQARQILTQMVARRLVLRLPRTVGGVRAGSSGFVYAMDTAGARLAMPQYPWQRRPWSVGLPFLAHSLGVTELFVRLAEAERLRTLVMQSFVGEPACWRSFAGLGGARTTLKPDAFLVTLLPGFEDRWFIELDRATESPATVARKCDLYRRYWQSGTEQARSDIFPRVLWLVPDDSRRGALVDVLGRQPAEAWPLFAVSVFSEGVNRIAQGAQV